MKAMILAAGRGERMQPLTNTTPKPLLKVGGRALIEYHLQRLAQAGIKEVIINIAYLGEQIREYLGDSFTADEHAPRVSIRYSEEPEPLETAGAILHALPLLGDKPFLLVNGDVWTDYPFEALLTRYSCGEPNHQAQGFAHVVLVHNPEHNLSGDFSLGDAASINGGYPLLVESSDDSYTFSGISVMSAKLLMEYPHKRDKFPLAEVLHFGIKHKHISAEVYAGEWRDIGTVERLESLDNYLKNDVG